jgi:serine/threonine protein kinase
LNGFFVLKKLINLTPHPNTVVFLGAKVVDKQKGLIVLELLMCSLHRAIYFPDEHNVAWAEPLLKHEMTLQIAQGLAYLHTARPRITHGDMKPANVMLTDRNVCRIIDFGLSVVKESSRMASHDPRIKAGNGTLHYQAPELLEAGVSAKRDHKVDVYAYAVTIPELFQQQPPYPSAMAVRDIEAIIKCGQRPIVDHLLVPADILALINVAWRQNKDQRPEFTAIVMGLLSFLQTGGGALAAVAAAAVATSSEMVSDLTSDVQQEHKRETAEQAALARETKNARRNRDWNVPSKRKRQLKLCSANANVWLPKKRHWHAKWLNAKSDRSWNRLSWNANSNKRKRLKLSNVNVNARLRRKQPALVRQLSARSERSWNWSRSKRK